MTIPKSQVVGKSINEKVLDNNILMLCHILSFTLQKLIQVYLLHYLICLKLDLVWIKIKNSSRLLKSCIGWWIIFNIWILSPIIFLEPKVTTKQYL